MPNIKSAIKRVKVAEKKNLRNRMVKSALKTQLKKFDEAVVAGGSTAQAALAPTVSAVDRAVSKGVIHRNTANRKKARLARRLHRQAAAE